MQKKKQRGTPTSKQRGKNTKDASGEARFRALIEHATEMIIILQPNGMINYASPSVKRIMGYAPEALVGKNVFELIHPGDSPRVMKEMQSIMVHTESTQLITTARIRHADGSWHVHEGVGTNLLHDPSVAGLVLNSRDITERMQAEEALRESEERYRTLAEAAHDMIFIIDQDDRVVYVNQYAARTLGLKTDEIIGSKREKLFPKNVSDQQKNSLKSVMETGKAFYIEDNASFLGHQVWLGSWLVPLRDEEGNIKSVLGISRDVTERKQAEQALLESEKKYRDLIDHSLLGIYITQNHIMKFCNQQLARIFGYENANMLIGMHAQELVAPENWDLVEQKVQLRESGETDEVHYELKGKKKDGKIIDLEVIGARIFYEGKPAIQGSILDISERKHLEAQLLQSQKLEAVGRLAGGVAHDFNNLLTTIMGYSDLLTEMLKDNDPLRSYVEGIVNSVKRAANLTQQLLALSRRHIVQLQILNLNTIITDTEKMLKRLIGEDIEVVTLLDPIVGMVKADPVQIEQVLMNLAVNARDAMPRGGRLTIQTANMLLDDAYCRRYTDLVPGSYVMLSLADTGYGMDADVMSHIFEPFFTTKEIGKGTGLGLSTVYGIIKQSGCHIEVASIRGKGSTFKIYFPRVEELITIPEPDSVSTKIPHGTETILLAEDDDKVRALVRQILQKLGYNVLEGSNGEEAFLLAKNYQNPIHLLLTDIIMPVLSGPDLAIQLLSLRPELKVLFMSGYTDGELASYGSIIRDMPFLQKPFQPDVLARRLREILDN